MVGKYSKTKNYKTEHRLQIQLEQERLKLLNHEYEAYMSLLRWWENQPCQGHYRTKCGFHMQIVSHDSSWSRQEVSDIEQQLVPGHAWLPWPPIKSTGMPLTVEQLYGDDASAYLRVEPRQIGFNNVGDFCDENGALYRRYQLKKLVVKPINNAVDYEAVTTNVLDPSREHIRVYESGAIFHMAPAPLEFCDVPATQSQLQSPPVQQAVDSPKLVGNGELRTRTSPNTFVSDGSSFGMSFDFPLDNHDVPGPSAVSMSNQCL
ncbi:hypothetical protein ACJQWK_10350 [Exserohilum turcicum]